jgi:DNA-binding Xre family transcriptional regulator
MKHGNSTPTIKNNLGKILEQKGFPKRYGKFFLGDSFLQSIGMSAVRLNRIVDNEVDMTVTELHNIAKKLDVEPESLLNNATQDADSLGIHFTK